MSNTESNLWIFFPFSPVPPVKGKKYPNPEVFYAIGNSSGDPDMDLSTILMLTITDKTALFVQMF